MHLGKDDHNPASPTQPGIHLADTSPSQEIISSLDEIDKDLVRTNAIIELFCRKLGDVLPGISLEIFHTYQRATETLDSLTSKTPPGLIDIAVDLLTKILDATEGLLRMGKAHDTFACKRAQDLCAKINHPWKSLISVHEISVKMSALIAETAPGTEAHRDTHAIAVSFTDLAEKTKESIQAINSISKDLCSSLKEAEQAGSECLQAVTNTGRQSIHDFEDTLNTVIMLFKDLIARSNSTKEPFLSIMTSLQVHDIVRQDIENVLLALHRVRQNRDGSLDREQDLFQYRACSLSSGLLDEISTIIKDHAGLIDTEINRIQDIVSGVKFDKDHLCEFLLDNHERESTIDSAISEITGMLDIISLKLQDLASKHERVQVFLPQLREQVKNLDHLSHEAMQSATALARSPQQKELQTVRTLKYAVESLREDISEVKASLPQEWLQTTNVVKEIQQLIASIKKVKEDVRKDLDKIKRLIIHSVDGINDYANRCMGAIKRFKRRLDRLYNNLQAISEISSKVKELSRITQENGDSASEPCDTGIEISVEPMAHLVYVLTNPHIRTLSREQSGSDEENGDDGLTFF